MISEIHFQNRKSVEKCLLPEANVSARAEDRPISSEINLSDQKLNRTELKLSGRAFRVFPNWAQPPPKSQKPSSHQPIIIIIGSTHLH